MELVIESANTPKYLKHFTRLLSFFDFCALVRSNQRFVEPEVRWWLKISLPGFYL
jgi:hypothetical protein